MGTEGGLKAVIALPPPRGGPRDGCLPVASCLGVSWALWGSVSRRLSPKYQDRITPYEAILGLLAWEGSTQVPWVPSSQAARARNILAYGGGGPATPSLPPLPTSAQHGLGLLSLHSRAGRDLSSYLAVRSDPERAHDSSSHSSSSIPLHHDSWGHLSRVEV